MSIWYPVLYYKATSSKREPNISLCFHEMLFCVTVTALRLNNSDPLPSWVIFLLSLTDFLFVSIVTLEQFALAVQECPVEEDHTLLTKVCVKPVFHSSVSHRSIGNQKLCF